MKPWGRDGDWAAVECRSILERYEVISSPSQCRELLSMFFYPRPEPLQATDVWEVVGLKGHATVYRRMRLTAQGRGGEGHQLAH